ncbi:17070_t:CDS:2, partial [Gigaspora rosea]
TPDGINKQLKDALPFSLPLEDRRQILALYPPHLSTPKTPTTQQLSNTLKKLNQLYGKVEMPKYTYNNQKKSNSTPT